MKAKFRAWDKKRNIMWQAIEMVTLLRYLFFQSMPNATAYTEVKDHFDEIVWLESTGLRDKNGRVENFESDLIRDERTEIVFEIVWNEDFAGWWCVSLDKTIEQPLHEINKFCAKIGTIYENPELIS